MKRVLPRKSNTYFHFYKVLRCDVCLCWVGVVYLFTYMVTSTMLLLKRFCHVIFVGARQCKYFVLIAFFDSTFVASFSQAQLDTTALYYKKTQLENTALPNYLMTMVLPFFLHYLLFDCNQIRIPSNFANGCYHVNGFNLTAADYQVSNKQELFITRSFV